MLSHQNRDRQEVFMMTKEASTEATVRNIRRKTRRKYTAEEKIRIVLEGLRGDLTIAGCREGISENLYYRPAKIAGPSPGAKTSLKPGNHALWVIQNEKPTASR
jgi:transposase